MKKTVLFAAVLSLFFGSALVAETNTDELTSGYNSPARIDVKGSWDIFLTGSYLYWQAREEGLELGRLFSIHHPEEALSTYKMEFDYKSGFKVSLGSNFDHDNWTSQLEYTHLHTKNHRNVGAVNSAEYVIFPFWNVWDGFDPATSATASWALRYDMLDLTLNRPFYSGSCFVLDGFGGLRGGWINQKYNFGCQFFYDQNLYDIDTVYYGPVKTNSWVIGPIGGLNMKYLLGCGFRLFGNASASLLYQRLKTTLKLPISYSLREYQTTNERETYNQITPNLNFATGLGWGTYFDKNNWYFDLSASYEFQYYWRQNRMKKLVDLIYTLGNSGTAKDLVLHGLTITGRFDF
jgi:hypothetical protein